MYINNIITKQGIGLGCCLFKLNLDIEISTLSYRGKAMYIFLLCVCCLYYGVFYFYASSVRSDKFL